MMKFLLWFYMIFFLLSLIILMSILNMMIHPIILIMLLISYTLSIINILSIWKEHYLYSIIIFLIIISGLLIIFLYFSTLISNESMSIYLNKNFLNLNILLLFMFSLMMYYSFNPSYFYKFKDTSMMNLFFMLPFSNILNLYMYPFNNFSILCMLFLLMILINIIKLCMPKSSSLRKLN